MESVLLISGAKRTYRVRDAHDEQRWTNSYLHSQVCARSLNTGRQPKMRLVPTEISVKISKQSYAKTFKELSLVFRSLHSSASVMRAVQRSANLKRVYLVALPHVQRN